MLFSNDKLARFLNATFECAVESLRPVPRVEIDFGNGRRLTRTLNGNVATYFCTAEGGVADIVPGLATPEDYERRAREAASLIAGLGDDAADAVARHHRARAGRRGKTGVPPDMSKMKVQLPIKRALAGLSNDPLKASLTADSAYNQGERMPAVHRLLAERPLAAPSELRTPLFRDILGVDIDDPYLGLAPYVLGGEGGRHEA